jgi:hypothetical protein
VKILRWCGAVWLLSLVSLSAQVTVEAQPEQKQFLPGEKLTVAVRITNLSGQPLPLGTEADWLSFDVESRDSFMVSERGKLSVMGAFTLESSKVAIKRVDLAPGFDLGQPGRYSVTATVRVKEWNQVFTSKPAVFDIIQGTKLWEKEFGVPPPAGGPPGAIPEVRKYLVQQASYLKDLRLYLRISDVSNTRIIKVISLGQLLSFSHPEPQVDRLSNLHLLWQTGARSFAYRVVSPDGEIIARQTHEYSQDSRPHLAVDKQGDIVVQGGQRRPTRDDLPPKEMTAPTNAVVAPAF